MRWNVVLQTTLNPPPQRSIAGRFVPAGFFVPHWPPSILGQMMTQEARSSRDVLSPVRELEEKLKETNCYIINLYKDKKLRIHNSMIPDISDEPVQLTHAFLGHFPNFQIFRTIERTNINTSTTTFSSSKHPLHHLKWRPSPPQLRKLFPLSPPSI